MSGLRFVLAVLGAVLLAGCPAPTDDALPVDDVAVTEDATESATDTLPLAVVDRVVDGDTVILVLDDGGAERVRLLGIDTPESVAENRPRQCYGEEASAALEGIIPPGSVVRIARDVEPRDQYDRLLLYLYRDDDGLFVNEWLVANGFADAVVYEPNVAFADLLARREREAVEAGLGLWSACDGPDQPLDPGE